MLEPTPVIVVVSAVSEKWEQHVECLLGDRLYGPRVDDEDSKQLPGPSWTQVFCVVFQLRRQALRREERGVDEVRNVHTGSQSLFPDGYPLFVHAVEKVLRLRAAIAGASRAVSSLDGALRAPSVPPNALVSPPHEVRPHLAE